MSQPNDKQRPDVLYLAGYSRSGSTALSMVLAKSAEIFNAGELTFLGDDYSSAHRKCSCGAEYKECEFWGDLRRDKPHLLSSHATKHIRRLEHRGAYRRLLNEDFSVESAQKYKTLTRGIVDWIKQKSQKPIVLDASKSARAAAGRALALHRYTNLNVAVIHLVREPGATASSYRKHGSNWASEGHGEQPFMPGPRSTVGWCLSNRAVEQMAIAAPGLPICRVRYEDLIADPVQELQKLSNWLGVDLSAPISAIERGELLSGEHSVGGNRARYNLAPFKGNANSATLPLLGKATVLGLAPDLLEKYGYRF